MDPSKSPHITHVSSNIKGGVDTDLSRLTLIVGPNGSGKTSIVNSIELALTGSVTDMEGRERVKAASSIARLGNGVGVTAKAVCSTGEEATWELTPKKRGGYFEPKHNPLGVDVQFPVDEVREILSGSAETIRNWLMGHFFERDSGQIGVRDIESRLPSEDADEFWKVAKGLRGRDEDDSGVDLLLEVVAAAKKKARSLKSGAKTAQATIDSLSREMPPEPTGDDLAKAGAIVEQARQTILRVSSGPRAPDLIRLRGEAQAKVAVFEEASKMAQAARNLSADLDFQGESEQVIAFRDSLIAVVEVNSRLPENRCLVCENSIGMDLVGKAERLKEENADGKEALLLAQKVEATAQDEASARIDAEQAISRLQRAEGDALKVTSQPDIAALSSAAEDARGALERLKAAQSQWSNLRAARDEARASKTQATKLEALADSCQDVLKELLAQAVGRFEMAVQAYLPDDDRFALVLEEDGKSVCRFGFIRDGHLHTALSGAEWARLTLALGCACARLDSDVLSIFKPEERALDADTLSQVMKALADAPGQVLLTSPVKPKGRAPKGWSVIDIGAATS
jgi:energy-coupling factor transporter ATP-binding protein EcfA2